MIYRAKLVFALFATKEQLLQVVIFFIARSAMPLLYYDKCEACGGSCERIGSDIRPVFAKKDF